MRPPFLCLRSQSVILKNCRNVKSQIFIGLKKRQLSYDHSSQPHKNMNKHFFIGLALCLFLLGSFTGCKTNTSTATSSTPPAAARQHKLTYVIVHGAWGGGWDWKHVDDLLTADGNKVYRATLTGQGERFHLSSTNIDLETHIQDVVNIILWEDLHDVVLVGHSYGGMIITGVADRVPDRIKHLVYLNALVPENGESVNTLPFRRMILPVKDDFIIPTWVVADARPPHDVPQSVNTFAEPISLKHQDVAGKIPATYILALEKGETACAKHLLPVLSTRPGSWLGRVDDGRRPQCSTFPSGRTCWFAGISAIKQSTSRRVLR